MLGVRRDGGYDLRLVFQGGGGGDVIVARGQEDNAKGEWD